MTFQTVEQLQAEIERLRTLVKDAFEEGFIEAREDIHFERTWRCSNTRAALQPKEGNQ